MSRVNLSYVRQQNARHRELQSLSRVPPARGSQHRPTRGKQVRIARTVANDFTYPTAPSSKYEIELGKIEFDESSLSGTPTFTPYTGTDRFRVAGLLNPLLIPTSTLVLIDLLHGQWYIDKPNIAMRILCLTNGALTSDCGPFNVDNVVGVDGPAPAVTQVYNPHRFTADDNALARVEYVIDNARWEIYQISCPGTQACP